MFTHAHTHKHMFKKHTYSHTDSHTHTHACTKQCSHTHKHTQSHTHTHAQHMSYHAHTHMHILNFALLSLDLCSDYNSPSIPSTPDPLLPQISAHTSTHPSPRCPWWGLAQRSPFSEFHSDHLLKLVSHQLWVVINIFKCEAMAGLTRILFPWEIVVTLTCNAWCGASLLGSVTWM